VRVLRIVKILLYVYSTVLEIKLMMGEMSMFGTCRIILLCAILFSPSCLSFYCELSSKPRSSLQPSKRLATTEGSDQRSPRSKNFRKKQLTTFQRYLEIECWKRAELRELEPVLQAVAEACKQINRIVQRAQTDDVYGAAVDEEGNPLEATNIQGEVQQKLDVLCNSIMLRAFCGSSRHISSIASEEEDEPRCCANVMVSGFMSSCMSQSISG